MWFGNSNGLLKLGAIVGVEEKDSLFCCYIRIMVEWKHRIWNVNEGADYYEYWLEMWRRMFWLIFLVTTILITHVYEYRLGERWWMANSYRANSTLTFYELLTFQELQVSKAAIETLIKVTLNLYISLPLIYYIGLFSWFNKQCESLSVKERQSRFRASWEWCFKSQPANEEMRSMEKKKYFSFNGRGMWRTVV